VSGRGISWAICMSAPRSRQITMPLSFLQAGCPSCRPTNSVKELKAMLAGTARIYMLSLCVWRILIFTASHNLLYSTHATVRVRLYLRICPMFMCCLPCLQPVVTYKDRGQGPSPYGTVFMRRTYMNNPYWCLWSAVHVFTHRTWFYDPCRRCKRNRSGWKWTLTMTVTLTMRFPSTCVRPKSKTKDS